mgnify:FL=1
MKKFFPFLLAAVLLLASCNQHPLPSSSEAAGSEQISEAPVSSEESVSSEEDSSKDISSETVSQNLKSAHEIFDLVTNSVPFTEDVVEIDAKYLKDKTGLEPKDFFGVTSISMKKIETVIVLVADSQTRASEYADALRAAMDNESGFSSVRDQSDVLCVGNYVVFLTTQTDFDKAGLTEKLRQ